MPTEPEALDLVKRLKFKNSKNQFETMNYGPVKFHGREEQLLIFATGKKIGDDCHACAPDTWAARFAQHDGGRWVLASAYLVEARSGGFGKSSPATIENAGPETSAVVIHSSGGGQGLVVSAESFFIERATGYTKVLELSVGYNGGCDEDAFLNPDEAPSYIQNGCTSDEKLHYEYLKTAHHGLFDIRVKTDSEERKPPKGNIEMHSKVENFVYDGITFKKASGH